MLKVTSQAISQIKKEIEPYIKDGKEQFVRLYMSVGWGGPQLQLALEESADANDQIVEVDDVKLLIAKRDAPYFEDRKLDYTKSFLGLGQFRLLHV